MCEQTEVRYVEKDIVWVKLGPCWWPGEVKDVENLPEEILSSFRKKPIAAVKFFQEEDKFEYVRNLDQICLYNCRRKQEFIKKGMDMYRAKRKTGSNFMDKFPQDVFIAEQMTHGDKEVVARLMFTEEERFNYKNIFGDDKSDKKNKDRKSKNLKTKSTTSPDSPPAKRRKSEPASALLPIASPVRRITHPRFLSPNTEHQVRIMEQSTSPPRKESDTKINCPLCTFQATRLNIIALHVKYHNSAVPKPESSPGNKSKTPGKSTPRKTSSQRKKSLTSSDISTPTPTSSTDDKEQADAGSDKEKDEKDQNDSKKSRTNIEVESKPLSRRSSRKSAVNDKNVSKKTPLRKTNLGKRKLGNSSQKIIKMKRKKYDPDDDDDNIQELLADWEDEVEDFKDKKEMVPIETDEESLNVNDNNVGNVADINTENLSMSDSKVSEASTSEVKASTSKPVKKKTVSCFDFDDSADAILDDELEERAKKFVETRKNPLIPSLEDRLDKHSNIIENVASTSGSNFSKLEGERGSKLEAGEEEDFSSEFQALMAETAVPHLPEIPIASHTDSLRNTFSANSIDDDDDDSQSTLSSLISKASKNHKLSRSVDAGSKFSFDDKSSSLTRSNVAKKEALSNGSITISASKNDDKGTKDSTAQPGSFSEETQFDDSKDSFSDLEHKMEIVCGEISCAIEDTASIAPLESSSQMDANDLKNDWETEDSFRKETVSSMLMTPEEKSATGSQPSGTCIESTNNLYHIDSTTVSESQQETSKNDDIFYVLAENIPNNSDVSISPSSSALTDSTQFGKNGTQSSTSDGNFDVEKKSDPQNNSGLSLNITHSKKSYQNIKKDKLFQILTENSVRDSNVSSSNHASTEGLKKDVPGTDSMQKSIVIAQAQNKGGFQEVVSDVSTAVSNSVSVTLPNKKINTQSFSNDYIELKHDTNSDAGKNMTNEIDMANNKLVTSQQSTEDTVIENIQKDIITIPADDSQKHHQSMSFVTEQIIIDNSAFLKDDDMEYDISSMPVVMTDAVIKDDSSGSFSTTILPDYQAVSMSPIIISPTSVSNTEKNVHTVVEMPSTCTIVCSSTASALQTSIIQSPDLTSAIKKVKVRAPAQPKAKNVPKTVVTPKGEKMLLMRTGQTYQFCGPASTQSKVLKPATVIPQHVASTSASKIVLVSSPQATSTQQKVIVSSLVPHQVVSGGQRLISSAGQVLTQVSPGTIITKGAMKYIGQQPVRLLAPMSKPKLAMKSTPTKITLPDIATSSASGVKVLGRLNPQTKTFVIQGSVAPTSTVITKGVTSGLTMQSKLATLKNPVRYQSPIKTGIQKLIGTNSVSRATITTSQATTPKFTIRTEAQKKEFPDNKTSPKTPTSNMSVITNASQLGKRVTGIFPMSQAAQGISKPQSIILSQGGKVPISSTNAPKLLTNQPLTSKGTTFQTIRKIQTVPSQRIIQPTVKRMPVSRQKVIAQSPKLVTTPLKVAEIRPKLHNPASGTVIQPVTSNVCTAAVSSISSPTIATASQSVTSNQIAHVVSETPSEQQLTEGNTYVIVAIDDGIGLQQYNNSTLLAYDSGSQVSSSASHTLYIDPSALGTSGDLSNMILTIDDSGTANTGAVLNLGHTPQSAENFTSETASISTTGSGQDILAVALANTDVFQPEVSLQDTLTVINNQHAIENSVITSHIGDSPSSLNQATMLLPSLSSVLPPTNPAGLLTSLTLNQPIMTPLEVPSCVSNLQIPPPVSLEIPLTITEPAVTVSPSQTLKQSSNASPTISAEVSSFQPSMPVISDDMTDPNSLSGSYTLTSKVEPHTAEVTAETGDQTSKVEHVQDHSSPLYSEEPVSTSDITNYIASIPNTSDITSVSNVTEVSSDANIELTNYMFDSSRTNGESETQTKDSVSYEDQSVLSVSENSVNIVENSGDSFFNVTNSNSSYIPASENPSQEVHKNVDCSDPSAVEDNSTQGTKSDYSFLSETALNNSEAGDKTDDINPQTESPTSSQPTSIADTASSIVGVSMPVLADEPDVNDKEITDKP